MRSVEPVPKSCVKRGGRESIKRREGGAADLESCQRVADDGNSLLKGVGACWPRRYELVSEEVSVSESESEFCLWASVAR